MNFIVNLLLLVLRDSKYNLLYIIINIFSKIVYLILTIINIKIEDIARLYFKNIYYLYKLLKSIISNRDIKFTSIF
jgi:hypothetical protein